MICARDRALDAPLRAYCSEASAVCAPEACQALPANEQCTEQLRATLDCSQDVRCEKLPPSACGGCCVLGAKGGCERNESVSTQRVPVCATRACTPARETCTEHAECCLNALGRRHCDGATRLCSGTTGVE